MLTGVLSEGLENYRIGPKIRSLRTEKSLGLAQLGDHTGLSAGMLSKIERGQVFPTLPTLMRISMVFGVGLDHFFKDAGAPILEVIRAKDRIKLPNTREEMPSFYFESLDFPVNDRPLEAYLAEFIPRTPATEPHEHQGVELIFIISGTLLVNVHDKTNELQTGDSMFFDSTYPHTYKCGSNERTTAIVVAARG
jgi:transcriptional regulator with XRE-family HTH domain